MEYSENKINALRKFAGLDGFVNLVLSEKDCAEYLEKFSYDPPDTSSETVALLSALKEAFDDERRKKIKEFWREKLIENRRKLAAESKISTFLHETTLSSLKKHDFANFVAQEKYNFPDYACQISIIEIEHTVRVDKKLLGLPFLPSRHDLVESKSYACMISPISEKVSDNNFNIVGFFQSLSEFFDWLN